jgi:hypothetical protein
MRGHWRVPACKPTAVAVIPATTSRHSPRVPANGARCFSNSLPDFFMLSNSASPLDPLRGQRRPSRSRQVVGHVLRGWHGPWILPGGWGRSISLRHQPENQGGPFPGCRIIILQHSYALLAVAHVPSVNHLRNTKLSPFRRMPSAVRAGRRYRRAATVFTKIGMFIARLDL